MPFYHLILCRSLFLLPSTFPSFRGSKSALHIRRPKYWSFSISPFNEYSGLTSFRTDWLDLIHSSVYMSMPISQFIPPPPLPPLLGLQLSFTRFLVTSRSLYLTLTFIQLPQRHFGVNLSEVECVFFPQFLPFPSPCERQHSPPGCPTLPWLSSQIFPSECPIS